MAGNSHVTVSIVLHLVKREFLANLSLLGVVVLDILCSAEVNQRYNQDEQWRRLCCFTSDTAIGISAGLTTQLVS